jgi:hypothetical protein
MKRAIFIFVAALLVLLVYPSTHPMAKAPGEMIVVSPPAGSPSLGNEPPIAQSDDSSDDSDDGDADSITGYKRGEKIGPCTNGPQFVQGRTMLLFEMWWNFVIWVR